MPGHPNGSTTELGDCALTVVHNMYRENNMFSGGGCNYLLSLKQESAPREKADCSVLFHNEA